MFLSVWDAELSVAAGAKRETQGSKVNPPPDPTLIHPGSSEEDNDSSPVQDLRDTSVADPQLSADHARSHPGGRHLDNLQPHVVWQRPPVDEHPTHLVDPALALERVASEKGGGHGGRARIAGTNVINKPETMRVKL